MKKQRLWAVRVTPKKGKPYLDIDEEYDGYGLHCDRDGAKLCKKEAEEDPVNWGFKETDKFEIVEIEIKEKSRKC